MGLIQGILRTIDDNDFTFSHARLILRLTTRLAFQSGFHVHLYLNAPKGYQWSRSSEDDEDGVCIGMVMRSKLREFIC